MADLITYSPRAVLMPLAPRPDIILPARSNGAPGGLSPWSVRQYVSCPYCWAQKYVHHRGPHHTSMNFAVGNAVHEALDLARQAKQKGQDRPPMDALEDAARDGFQGTLEGRREDGSTRDEPPVIRWTKAELDTKPDELIAANKDASIALVRATVPTLLEAEAPFDVMATECYIDFDGVFPFPFVGKADVVLSDPHDWAVYGHIKDDKTAGKSQLPDEWTAAQLVTYDLPFWLAGEPYTLGVDQFVKTKEPQLHLWTEPGYTLRPTEGEMRAQRELIIRVAEEISADMRRGYFRPAPPTWGEHDFPHETPKFYIAMDPHFDAAVGG